MSELVLYDPERVGGWVAEKVNHNAGWGSFYAFGIDMDGKLVAGVVVHQMNGANAGCHIAIEKPVKALVNLFQVVCEYAFVQCGLKRLTGLVPTNEQNIIKFDKHLGFEEECVLKDAAPGADMQVLVMWADNCRWLRKD